MQGQPAQAEQAGTSEHSNRGLQPLLQALRRRGDEAQLTQILAAFAGSDPRFAGSLATALVSAAPRSEAVQRVGPVPEELSCTAEQPLRDRLGSDKGYVDLKFDSPTDRFTLLVELKLGSDYGYEQLQRYLDALAALPAGRSGLLAITRTMPQVGEEAADASPQWLGSVRWAQVFDDLRQLRHANPDLDQAWQEVLELIKKQGDFGPMDFDPSVVEAWARRDESETLVRFFLTEIAKPALAIIRQETGGSPESEGSASQIMYGSTNPIFPWKNRFHIRYEVPSGVGEERLRLQVLAAEGKPFFTVEGRYDHPREPIPDAEGTVDQASRTLEAKGFSIGRDGEGYYWAKLVPAERWLYRGSETVNALLGLVRENVGELARSGLLRALAQVVPATPPASTTESLDQDEGTEIAVGEPESRGT